MRSDEHEVDRMVGEGCPHADEPHVVVELSDREKALVLLMLGGQFFRKKPGTDDLVPSLSPGEPVPLRAVERLIALGVVRVRFKNGATWGLASPAGIEFALGLYARMVKGA